MKHTLIYTVLCLSLSLIAASFIIHQRGQRSLPNLPEGSRLILAENFDDPSILSSFRQGEADLGHSAGSKDKPAWRISEGQLYGEGAHNAALWLKAPLPPGDLRISFTATALSEEGDVKCEVFGDGQHHQSGYILINGGWKNSVRAIARQDEHGEDRRDDHRCNTNPLSRRCAPAHQEQDWVIERRGQKIDWYIDGLFVLSYNDQNAIKGRHFGFNNWSAAVRFDRLRIYQLAVAHSAD